MMNYQRRASGLYTPPEGLLASRVFPGVVASSGGSAGAGPGAFSDLDLMTSGGFLLHLNDTTKIFTDSAGTTPVSADGDYVHYATDLSGTAGYLFQNAGDTAAPNWNATEQACYFDGGTDAGRDFLYNTNSYLQPSISAGTLAARVRFDTGKAGYMSVIGLLESATQRFYLGVDTGVLKCGIGDKGTTVVYDPSNTDLRSATVFHTIALTWGASNWTLYLDGASVNSGSHAGSSPVSYYLPVGTERISSGYGYDLFGSIKYAMFEGHECSATDMGNLHDAWSV